MFFGSKEIKQPLEIPVSVEFYKSYIKVGHRRGIVG